MSINKNGIWTSPILYEKDANNLYFGLTNSYSYVPSTKNNSCLERNIPNSNFQYEQVRYHIEFDIVYSGFTDDNPDGTFSIHSNHKAINSEGTNTWSRNPFDDAWESYVQSKSTNLKTLVLSQESGTFHVDTYTVTLTATDVTYQVFALSIRSDYSNGIGRISFDNIKITPAYLTGDKAAIRQDAITANSFIEI